MSVCVLASTDVLGGFIWMESEFERLVVMEMGPSVSRSEILDGRCSHRRARASSLGAGGIVG